MVAVGYARRVKAEGKTPSGSRSRWLLETAIAASPLLVVGALPAAWTTLPLDQYVPLHSLAEIFSVVVAMLVFASGWSTAREREAGAVAVVAAGFLGVGLLDCAHLLSYASMPRFVTPSGPAKAIYFWLAARGLAALTMLSVPLLSTRVPWRRHVWLIASLALTVGVYAAVLFAPSSLPEVFVPDVGLTATKRGIELVNIGLYTLAFGLLVERGASDWRGASVPLVRAALLMALGEIPFALYSTVSDGFNFVGHAYKVAAYVFLYRAIFVETVRRPYAELRTSVAALEESESRFRQLAENIREVFWLRDVDSGRFVYLSPGFEAVFGSPPETVTDLDMFMPHVHADDRAALRETIDGAIARGAPSTVEYRIVRPDGEVRWVRALSFPVLGASGSPVRVAGITTDVTAERNASELLARAQRMEGLGRLAGGVAHDFNNLLTVIYASIELARAELPPDHPAQADLQQTFEAATRARELTAQLLAFARKRPGEVRHIDIGELVARSSGLLRPLVGTDIELSLLVEPGEHVVEIDASQMEQVIMNLIVNAKDAMPSGGIIVASVNRVDAGPPGVDTAGPWMRLRVEDNGVGMAPEVAKHAFEPFFTTKGPGKGTGLGLATSFGIIAQAGGSIAIVSAPGQGTKMDVLLPLKRGPVDRIAEVPAHRADSHGTETILVVDDEAAVRTFTARVLRQNGYQVLTAANGRDALDLAEKHSGPIDLLLTDLVMPLMGGHELASRVLASRPNMLVLFVSGYPGESQTLSPHPLFVKPYTGSALLVRIRQHLDARRETTVEAVV